MHVLDVCRPVLGFVSAEVSFIAMFWLQFFLEVLTKNMFRW